MSEHTHKSGQPKEEVNIQIGDTGCCRPRSTQNFLAISVLVGAVLIAGSIFYNTKAVLKKLDAGGIVLAGGTGQQVLPDGQGNAAADDSQPVQISDRQSQPTIGDKDAKLTLYEFSDFQCPFCARFFKETYSVLKSKYIDTGKVKLVFRQLPLGFHQNAQKAAEAAECANRQGKFEQYHDLLFQNGQSDGTGLAVEDLKKYADQLGLNKGTLGFNKNQFNKCLDEGQAAEAVKQDTAEAGKAGIGGTPTFVLNGKKIVGAQPSAIFEQAIEEALK